MKKSVMLCALAVFGLVALPALAMPKTYQVTGPVLEMSADKIVVQKGSEKWEIQRGSINLPADVKVGSKVMIEYTMTAANIIDKSAPGMNAPANMNAPAMNAPGMNTPAMRK
jgi:hypothetical protein